MGNQLSPFMYEREVNKILAELNELDAHDCPYHSSPNLTHPDFHKSLSNSPQQLEDNQKTFDLILGAERSPQFETRVIQAFSLPPSVTNSTFQNTHKLQFRKSLSLPIRTGTHKSASESTTSSTFSNHDAQATHDFPIFVSSPSLASLKNSKLKQERTMPAKSKLAFLTGKQRPNKQNRTNIIASVVVTKP
eukprot:c7068_g1_i1.p1 GENE.c7068_g1_i1~~c7068_g1_i1.p1  ORF type:complete len:191 (+),score=50.38 c7068_g1_i1:161-733(+)